MQNGLKLNSVDELLSLLPEDELEIVEWLRALILDTLPDSRETLSYNVPYYSINRRICFIWPGSMPWGGTRRGVRLGFAQGNLLTDPDNILDKGARQYVYTIDFARIESKLEEQLTALLLEAAELDQMA